MDSSWRKILSWQEGAEWPLVTLREPKKEVNISVNDIGALIPSLGTWLQTLQFSFPFRIVNPIATARIRRFDGNLDKTIYFTVRTRKSDYYLSASPRDAGDYLGAIATERRTGKGNDLEDGRFSISTWKRIIQDIEEYER